MEKEKTEGNKKARRTIDPITLKEELVKTVENIDVKNRNQLNQLFKISSITRLILRNRKAEDSKRSGSEAIVVITDSLFSKKLAYAANTVDGIIESISAKIDYLVKNNAGEELKDSMPDLININKELTDLIENLNSLIERSLEKGIGRRYDVIAYQEAKEAQEKEKIKEIINKNDKKIWEMFLKDENIAEIAKSLKIDEKYTGLIEAFISNKKAEVLESKKELIKKALLEDKQTRREVAEKLKIFSFASINKRLKKWLSPEEFNSIIENEKIKRESEKDDNKSDEAKEEENNQSKN